MKITLALTRTLENCLTPDNLKLFTFSSKVRDIGGQMYLLKVMDKVLKRCTSPVNNHAQSFVPCQCGSSYIQPFAFA